MDADLQEDFAILGVPVPISEEPDDGFEVWRQNWESVMAFLSCQSQSNYLPTLTSPVWIGLNYVGVDVFLRRRNSEPTVFDDILVMEAAALEALSEIS